MNAAEIVESNEDLLIEILVLLPPKSVFRFMCVSKRWNNIIDNPFFRQSCRHRHSGGRPLAFIEETTIMCDCLRLQINILPIYTQGNHPTINKIPERFGQFFINSSNGLILLCCLNLTIFHVVNPVAEKSVSPPPPPPLPYNYWYHTSVGLMCKENTSGLKANYIIVRAHHSTGTSSTLHLQTYSSKTGQWALSTLAATGEFQLLNDKAPVVANGVFHWFAVLWKTVNRELSPGIMVYNPNDDNHNSVQLIQLPSIELSFKLSRSLNDILWFVEVRSVGMELWMLPKGEERSYMRATTIPRKEWVLMYNINVESICSALTLKIKNRSYFIFEAFISWDPIVVLLKSTEQLFPYNESKLFLYNIESKSYEMIRYHGSLDEFDSDQRV